MDQPPAFTVDRHRGHQLADSSVSINKARDRLGYRPRMSNRDAVLVSYD
ncbi:hypothetical protein ACIP68_00440 [Streptomyces griseoviridis]